MRTHLGHLLSIAAASALLGCAAPAEPVVAQQEQACQSDPIFVPDNPTCESLGYGTIHFKIDPPASGDFDIDGFNWVHVDIDGLEFDWSASLGIDAIIVKGGPNANLYTYDPEAWWNDGEPALHAPVNPTSGDYYGLSHIDFCFDYELNAWKTAMPSFDRTYVWTIDKGSDVSSLLLSDGQVYGVGYWVDLAATPVDSNFAVSGSVYVFNPSPFDAVITSITDTMGDIAVPLDCGVEFPTTLAPWSTLTCSYQVAVPDASLRCNVALVETSGLVGGDEANDMADFDNEAVVNSIDTCLTASDDHFGPLGTFCEPGPHHVGYSLPLGPFECGEHDFVNTASFVTDDLGATGSDSWTVHVSVPCPEGCTLTPGYWKTHSEYGPAPYDDTWAQLPQGADTPFYLSGQSYYQVLWTPPSGGNAYYILAHATIAAQLNALDGAGLGDAAAALAEAEDLFGQITPEQIATLRGKAGSALRGHMIDLAEILDAFNNGFIGPGHCDQ